MKPNNRSVCVLWTSHHKNISGRLLISILGWALTLAVRSQLSMYMNNASFSYTFLLQKIIFTESNKVLAQSFSRWDTWLLSRFHATWKKPTFLVWNSGKGSIKHLWSQRLQLSALSPSAVPEWCAVMLAAAGGGWVGHRDRKNILYLHFFILVHLASFFPLISSLSFWSRRRK